MTKYRFKTREEFEREGLLNYGGVPKGWNSEGAMNRFLGADIPIKYNALCDRKEEISIDSWHFLSRDYILKTVPKPNSMLVDKPKYRLKTEEEFKRDGQWGTHCPRGWAIEMIKHLGERLDSKYNAEIDEAIQTNKSLVLTIDDKFWSFRYTDFVLIDTPTISRDWRLSMERDMLSAEEYFKPKPIWYPPPMREEKQRVEPMKNIR